MGNLVTYAAERRGNPDEGMGVGLEGSRWDSGEEAGRGGGEKRGRVQRRQEYLVVREYAYRGERCEGATAPARNPSG